jgi:hypothetical protein
MNMLRTRGKNEKIDLTIDATMRINNKRKPGLLF